MKLFFSVRLKSEIPSMLSSHCFNVILEATVGSANVVNVATVEVKPHEFPTLFNCTR